MPITSNAFWIVAIRSFVRSPSAAFLSRVDCGRLARVRARGCRDVPTRADYPREWVEDTVNIVAACGACNGLFNRDPAVGAVPTTLDEFLAIRDALFVMRKARIQDRRSVELEWYAEKIRPRAQR